jgi:hypothetical protein
VRVRALLRAVHLAPRRWEHDVATLGALVLMRALAWVGFGLDVWFGLAVRARLDLWLGLAVRVRVMVRVGG